MNSYSKQQFNYDNMSFMLFKHIPSNNYVIINNSLSPHLNELRLRYNGINNVPDFEKINCHCLILNESKIYTLLTDDIIQYSIKELEPVPIVLKF